jgi:anaphase-promoting complex subunit 1
LFQGSGHRHITETFLAALETTIFDVPSEPLALGTAIGLVNLGMGDDSSILRESRERLCVIFSGSKSVDARNDRTATFGNSDFFAVAPAAVLALALGYMRTDHSRVKLALELPNDAAFVNAMLPDIILLRTMASLLVDSDPRTALNFAIPTGLGPETLASLVTGFSIACGLKLAGSLNLKAFERLQTIARCLALIEKTPFDFAECPALRREQCLAMVVLAASLVIAGTCDVGFLRFVRFVRRRVVTTSFQQYVFGLHAVLGMAIGIANLGRGRYTIGMSLADTAAVLVAIFPRFSRTPSDNDFSVQALRHLVAAAAVPRVLETRDIDTDEIVSIYACVGLPEGNLAIRTPHVLPPLREVESLRIDDPLYFTVVLAEFPFRDEKVRPIIWLKKRQKVSAEEGGGVETLRTICRMKENPLFGPGGGNDLARVALEIEWDTISGKVADFFRCASISRRTQMISEDPRIRDFLVFHGLPPGASLSDTSGFSSSVLAFLIPSLTPEELAVTFR